MVGLVQLHSVVLISRPAWNCESLVLTLSRAPVEVMGRETKLWNACGCYKACWIKTSKHLTVITSGVEGEEEARSAVLGEDYQVSNVLSAASLMLVLSALFGGCMHGHLYSGASPSMPWHGRRWGMMQPAGRLCFSTCDHMAHYTRTTPTTPPGLTTAGFFT